MDMDMFWLPEYHTLALRITFYILHCEVCRKVKNLKALLFVRSEVRRG